MLAGVASHLPPGWPTGVHPPGSAEFEPSAVAWLLEVVPPGYLAHGVLRRHPVALAALARHHLTACVEGARNGYRTARAELGPALPPAAVEAVLAAYRAEGGRLAALARAAGLVERALRGEAFDPQISGARAARPEPPGGPRPGPGRARRGGLTGRPSGSRPASSSTPPPA